MLSLKLLQMQIYHYKLILYPFLSGLNRVQSYSVAITRGFPMNPSRTEYSGTKLYWAAYNNQLSETRQLLNSAKELGILSEFINQKSNESYWEYVSQLGPVPIPVRERRRWDQTKTALEIAREKGHTEIVEVLAKAGGK